MVRGCDTLINYMYGQHSSNYELKETELCTFWQAEGVNGSIDMRVWKGRRFENILKLDRDLR
jgi:hypothetical protein